MSIAGFYMAIVLGLVLLAPVVAGLLILRLERRGRPAEACCGSCRYPVAAILEATGRCPECGALLADVGVLAPRRRRPALLALAMVLICLPIVGVGLMVAANVAFEAQVEARRAEVARQAASAEEARLSELARLKAAEESDPRLGEARDRLGSR